MQDESSYGSKNIYTYDQNGNNLTIDTTYYIDIWSKVENGYDQNGNLIYKFSTSSSNQNTKYYYAYDKYGNMIESFKVIEGAFTSSSFNNCTYELKYLPK